LGRRLGQHFLTSRTILDRIAAEACPDQSATVVEIGPGKGSLTTHLLARAARVIAIEIDPVLVHYLRAKFAAEPRLTLIDADVLKTDLAQWGRVTVTGNLPYYITSPILEKTLALGPNLAGAVFMVQKEVAERITAKPATRDWGYLSVQTQLQSNAELLFTIPASAFHPPPKVDSAIVRLTPISPPPDTPMPPPSSTSSAHASAKSAKKSATTSSPSTPAKNSTPSPPHPNAPNNSPSKN
jgi:16S rRNA (adenine1518-N6/adenine1519-N6)-dimethyltransferase